jgi:hypothetical protein
MGNMITKKQEKQKTEIDLIVDRLLANPKINLSGVPDALERQIYVAVLTILSENIHQLLSGVEIKILNKKITLTVEDITVSPPDIETE